MSESIDTAGEQKAPKPERKKLFRRAGMWVGGLLGLIAIADETRVGAERFDIRTTYERTLERAERDYAEDPNRCEEHATQNPACIPFRMFLNERDIPQPELVEGIVRLIGEFKHPVRTYSGTTLSQKFLEWAGGMLSNFNADGRYEASFPVEIRGHEIFLPNMVREDEGELRLTTEDVGTIIAELAHAYHVEDEGSFQAFLDHLKDMPHLLTSRGYRGAYVTPGTGEYKAHREMEPLLVDRLEFLIDDMRGYLANHMLDYTAGRERGIDERAPELAPEEFTYARYEEMLGRLSEEVSRREPMYPAEETLRILEQLAGFNARIEQLPDKTTRLVLLPNQEHYEATLALLRPYEPDGRTITDIMPRITPDSARAMLASFEQFEEERGQYERRSQDFRFFVALVIGSVTPDTEFTREVYERVMEKLREEYPRISALSHQELEVEDQLLLELLGVVNGVSRFDPLVQGRYGVYPAPDAGHRLVPPQVITGDEHFEALKRIFDRTR